VDFGTADSGDANESIQRQAYVDAFEVVLGGADDLQIVLGRLLHRRTIGARRCGALFAVQVLRCQGARASHECIRGPIENHFAASLTGTGAKIQHAIRGQHDLRVVLDDDQ